MLLSNNLIQPEDKICIYLLLWKFTWQPSSNHALLKIRSAVIKKLSEYLFLFLFVLYTHSGEQATRAALPHALWQLVEADIMLKVRLVSWSRQRDGWRDLHLISSTAPSLSRPDLLDDNLVKSTSRERAGSLLGKWRATGKEAVRAGKKCSVNYLSNVTSCFSEEGKLALSSALKDGLHSQIVPYFTYNSHKGGSF